MCSKLLNLCIGVFFLTLATTASAQLLTAPISPDVELLPAVSAVSSQVIHRIHNKLIPGPPPLSPLFTPNPFPIAAPLRSFPQPVVAPLPTSPANFAFSQPFAPLTVPLSAAPRPLQVPFSQQVAPALQSFGIGSSPFIASPFASSFLIAAPSQVVAPSLITPAQFPPAPLLRRRLRPRFNNRRRPSAVRRFPANQAYQRFRL